MSKLSSSLKAIINAPVTRPRPVTAARAMAEIYQGIARDAARHKVGTKPWLAISVRTSHTCTVMHLLD